MSSEEAAGAVFQTKERKSTGAGIHYQIRRGLRRSMVLFSGTESSSNPQLGTQQQQSSNIRTYRPSKTFGNLANYRSVVGPGAKLRHGWGKNSNNLWQGRGMVGAQSMVGTCLGLA